MAKYKKEYDNENKIDNEIKTENKSDKLVLITRNCLSVYRKESELDKYIDEGWKVSE